MKTYMACRAWDTWRNIDLQSLMHDTKKLPRQNRPFLALLAGLRVAHHHRGVCGGLAEPRQVPHHCLFCLCVVPDQRYRIRALEVTRRWTLQHGVLESLFEAEMPSRCPSKPLAIPLNSHSNLNMSPAANELLESLRKAAACQFQQVGRKVLFAAGRICNLEDRRSSRIV